MTRRNLDSPLVFIVYSDLLWAPREQKVKNPKRFSMLFAPITRVHRIWIPTPATTETTEQLEEDYFTYAFGENWQQARDYLQKISDLFDFEHMIRYPVFGVCSGISTMACFLAA